METENIMKQVNSLTYRMVGNGMKATLAGVKLVKEFQNDQMRNAIAAVWGLIPKEVKPFYDRTESLIQTQYEAVEQYLEDVAAEFITMSETGGPSLYFDEVQKYLVSQVQIMLEQYDRSLDLFKGQADRAREMMKILLPKEMHPVLEQSEALLKEQYRAWREGVQKVIPSPETSPGSQETPASPSEQAPQKPKRK